jgi:hypothetical protein
VDENPALTNLSERRLRLQKAAYLDVAFQTPYVINLHRDYPAIFENNINMNFSYVSGLKFYLELG